MARWIFQALGATMVSLPLAALGLFIALIVFLYLSDGTKVAADGKGRRPPIMLGVSGIERGGKVPCPVENGAMLSGLGNVKR
jgi:hypothetical protein